MDGGSVLFELGRGGRLEEIAGGLVRNVLRASSSALRTLSRTILRGAERTIAFSELGGRSRLRLRGSRDGDRLR